MSRREYRSGQSVRRADDGASLLPLNTFIAVLLRRISLGRNVAARFYFMAEEAWRFGDMLSTCASVIFHDIFGYGRLSPSAQRCFQNGDGRRRYPLRHQLFRLPTAALRHEPAIDNFRKYVLGAHGATVATSRASSFIVARSVPAAGTVLAIVALTRRMAH